MDAPPPQIDEMAVELVCWQVWWNGPLDGLASWSGVAYWFAMLQTWDEDDGNWGYDYGLFELDERRLRTVVGWFRERERNKSGGGPLSVVDSHMSLQGSDGPDLPGPVAWFRHRGNTAWHPVNCRDRWRLPGDWPASII